MHVNEVDDLEKTIDQLFITHKTVDGILSIDNTSGVVALQKGFNIPEELSIIDFSDDNVLVFTNPKLSTVSQHTMDIGKAAVELLIVRLDQKNTITTLTKKIKTKLILRETTK